MYLDQFKAKKQSISSDVCDRWGLRGSQRTVKFTLQTLALIEQTKQVTCVLPGRVLLALAMMLRASCRLFFLYTQL